MKYSKELLKKQLEIAEEELLKIEKRHNEYTFFIKKLKEQLTLTDVVNWLPFVSDNYKRFSELARENRLLKKFDDGSIIKQGEQEPLAICTHFAEQQ